MKVSNSSMFLTLYKKDIMSVKFESFILVGVIILGYLYGLYKINTDRHVIAIIPVSILVFTVVTFVIFLATFNSVRREWNNNTIYLMISLPVGGKSIFFSAAALYDRKVEL